MAERQRGAVVRSASPRAAVRGWPGAVACALVLALGSPLVVRAAPGAAGDTAPEQTRAGVTPSADPEVGGSAAPPGGVRRIVSLVPSVTETIFALGRGDRLVGISTFCDYPPDRVRGIERAGSYLTPNVERIVALEPDVVIGVPTPGNQAAVEQLRDLGLDVVIVGERTLGDTWQAIRTIGRWTGSEEGAEELVARAQGEIAGVRAAASRLPRRKVLFVVGHDPLVAAGSGLFIDELIAAAGGVNVAAATGTSWPRLSLEAVVAYAPEVIVDGAMGSEANQALEAYWHPYASVPAVREGRVRAQRSEALLRPGPRVGIAARELFAMLHDDPARPAAAEPAHRAER